MSFRRFAAICLAAGLFGAALAVIIVESSRPDYRSGMISAAHCGVLTPVSACISAGGPRFAAAARMVR